MSLCLTAWTHFLRDRNTPYNEELSGGFIYERQDQDFVGGNTLGD